MTAWKATFCISDTFIATYRLVTIKKFLQFCNDGTVCIFNAIMLELQGSSMAKTTHCYAIWNMQPAIQNQLFQKVMTSQGKNLTKAKATS